MMQNSLPGNLLRTSGNLLSGYGYVGASIFFRHNTELPKSLDNRKEKIIILQNLTSLFHQAIVHIAQIMINRSSTTTPSNNGDSSFFQLPHIHFLANILVAAYNHRRTISPKKKNILLHSVVKKVFFQGLVIKRIQGRIDDSNHMLALSMPKILQYSGKIVRFPLYDVNYNHYLKNVDTINSLIINNNSI